MFLQYGTMTGTFCFMTGTNSLVLVNLTGRSPKIISRLANNTGWHKYLAYKKFPLWILYYMHGRLMSVNYIIKN
jgi:hypothetical protein